MSGDELDLRMRVGRLELMVVSQNGKIDQLEEVVTRLLTLVDHQATINNRLRSRVDYMEMSA